MAQVFTPIHNMYAKLSLIGLIVGVVGFFSVMDLIHRSSYVRYTKIPRSQPVPFSHRHHASMGIDCRYCHTTVENGSFANVPPTKTCMNCHKQIWAEAPMLEPVRESWKNKESIEWVRVHDLPDFVYFNHAIHVNKGVGCSTCHGQVDDMPLMHREHPLFMAWCLECHRDPAENVRPKDKIFDMAYKVKSLSREEREALVEDYAIDHADNRLTNCSICHR